MAAAAEAWSTSAPPGCATTSCPAPGAREAGVVLGDGTDADVVAFAGRARGRRPGLPRARWPGPGPARLDHRQGRGRRHRRAGRAVLLQVYGGVDEQTGVGGWGGRRPREVLVPELPAEHEVYAELLSELRGSRVSLRVPQRGDKRSHHGDRRAQREGGLRRHRVKRAGDLTARSLALCPSCRRPSTCPTPRCASSAWTSATCRAPTWWPAWSCSRTAWPRRATTAVPGRPGHRRHRGDGRGRAPPVRPAPEGGGRPGRRAGRGGRGGPAPPVRLPAPTCWWSTAGSPRSPPRPARWPSSVCTTSPSAGWPSAWRRSGCRRPRPGDPAAHLRGALPAAAGARRGAPLRDHLPPAEAGPPACSSRCSTTSRAGRHPAQGVDEGVRVAQAAAGRLRRRPDPCARHRPPHGRGGAAAVPSPATRPPPEHGGPPGHGDTADRPARRTRPRRSGCRG